MRPLLASSRESAEATELSKLVRQRESAMVKMIAAERAVDRQRELRNNNQEVEDDNQLKLDDLRIERQAARERFAALEMAFKQVAASNVFAVSSLSSTITTNNHSNTLTEGLDGYYTSKSTNLDSAVGPPANAITLGVRTFKRELRALLKGIYVPGDDGDGGDGGEGVASAAGKEVRRKLSQLKLSTKGIDEREKKREAVQTTWTIYLPYKALCLSLDLFFRGSPAQRFWFLETVARIPYFAYITLIHTYETLGWWRRSTVAKRVHFAEELNEYNHLLIMESLGGDQSWFVRFLAQHSALAYFFILILLWILSPSRAYNFSELIEAHAVDTYQEFAESNKDVLESMPVPTVATAYYENQDMYHFDEFQTGTVKGSRRPELRNLYDVFCNIAIDERAHVATMKACQDPSIGMESPNSQDVLVYASFLAGLVALITLGAGGVGLGGEMGSPEEMKLEEGGEDLVKLLMPLLKKIRL